eukprot:TRINITY_DN3_c0_g1_i1.p1 TRINITY_DN3_c0_g1~~TRINITY_DN3_c0_g1_i1.p1  ORF type:complete len:382 (+),score=40.47 TRINITY_DN3_c0_g1_i1:92-1237(+)
MLKASFFVLLPLAATGLLLAAPGKVVQHVNNTASDVTRDAPTSLGAVRNDNRSVDNSTKGWTFGGWYNAYAQGRGIWKWSNAIAAYQPQLGRFIGLPIHMAEIGVQSGGSLTMWHSVIGAQCHVYGLDINPESLQFKDASTTIVIGDQEDPKMWQNFFTNTVKSPLSILVDDGGHEPNQMFVTLREVFPKLTADGVIAIEDIHISPYSSAAYSNGWFNPAAIFLANQAQQGKLTSVHLYPFLLIATREQAPRLPMQGGKSEVVPSMAAIWEALARVPGGQVIYKNPSPGASFLNTPALMQQVFKQYESLHGGGWTSVPQGCHQTAAAVCSLTVTNTPAQNRVAGIHIYSDMVVVDVPATPPVIAAIRHGTEWITSRPGDGK